MTTGTHYELYGLLLFALLSGLPAAMAIALGLRWLRARRSGDSRKAARRFILGTGLALAVYTVVVVDAYLVEPNWPRQRTIMIEGNVKSELRVLHISDLHIEAEEASWERWLVSTLSRTLPDVIFITGDILQLGRKDAVGLTRVTGCMNPPLGVYACAGYDNIAMLWPANTNIVYLQDCAVSIEHGSDTVAIAGSPRSRLQDVGRVFGKSDYRIVLEHTPDHVEGARSVSADLYLCGHTHGGQVRIPFWGAIITLSRTGKKYESGLYSEGGMFIHTSRGLGLEPHPAPQVRFFCRPEATLIRIVPHGSVARS